ncbi:MAG: glycosyltransferase family protein [Phycisphaerales bacterium]
MHLLILGRGERTATPDGHQVQGFRMYERELREALGISFDLRRAETLGQIEREAASPGSSAPDAVLVLPSWRETPEALSATLRRVREASGARLVLVDYFAPTSSPHFGVLPDVDVYAKRQLLRDVSAYLRPTASGFVYADFVRETWGFDLDGWSFGSVPEAAELHKLVPGWNLGVAFRYRQLLRWSRRVSIPHRLRPIAVNRRIGTINRVGRTEWYQFSRQKLVEAVSPVTDRVRTTGLGRVPTRRYLAELAMSRITLSPFGWGEVCFRDYEAVALGSLLVKPDMGHLQTSPDIYVPGETYVPIRWDFADAAEVVDSYLRRPGECARIIRNAREVLGRYFEGGGFVDDIRRTVVRPLGGVRA